MAKKQLTDVFHSGATAVSVALWEQSIDDDAPVLQYHKLNDSPYNGTTDPQVYLDLAQAITNLKEIK